MTSDVLKIIVHHYKDPMKLRIALVRKRQIKDGYIIPATIIKMRDIFFLEELFI